MLQRIYEDSNLASMIANINQAVSFKGIAIRISGTNGATKVEMEDVGRIQYIKNGQHLINMGFDMLVAINEILGGHPNISSAASGALDFWVYIPRGFNDANVESVVPADNASIKCTFNANLATRVASGGKVEVYLDLEDGIQKYDLLFNQYSESLAGAGVKPLTIENDNIVASFISATVSGVLTTVGSNITQIMTKIGAKTGDCSLGSLLDHSQSILNLEAAYSIAAVNYMATGDLTSKLHDNMGLNITSDGASTPEIGIISMKFDRSRLEYTLGNQNTRFMAQLQSKKAAGRIDSIGAIRKIAAQRSVG